MYRTIRSILSSSFAAALLLACGESEPSPPPAAAGSTLPETFWSAQAPSDPVEVTDLRGLADGAEIAVRGEVRDFVAGRSAFTLADHALTSCAEMEVDDHCATPWDFCCEDPKALAEGTALVEFRRDGELLAAAVRGFHGLDHLSDVVVSGTLAVDEVGNLLVVASGLHVSE